MVLDPEDGGQYGYFILRPVYGEALSGERVGYATALGVYSGASTVELVQIDDIDTDYISVTKFGGVPWCIDASSFATGDPSKTIIVEAVITYDGGGIGWHDAPDGGESVFLVELVGNQSYFDVYDGSGTQSAYLEAFVMSDGGQYVRVYKTDAPPLQDTIWTIKIWRVGGTPTIEPTEFWTGFVGSREII